MPTNGNAIGVRFGRRPHIFGPAGSVTLGQTLQAGDDTHPLRRYKVTQVTSQSCSTGQVDVGYIEPTDDAA